MDSENAWPQLYFDEVDRGDQLCSATYGPLTITDTVHWAGVQENDEPIHWDRDYARQAGLKTFIASGGYRQALVIRSITDRLGPRGQIRQLSLKHTAPTYEGDMLHVSVNVIDKAPSRGRSGSLTCLIQSENQSGTIVLKGTCVVSVPLAEAAL